jgi:hypothetical protein
MIGSDQVQSLYTHNIDLVPRAGPSLDRAEIALEFPTDRFLNHVLRPPFHVYGVKIQAPSTANHIDCKPTEVGFLCTIYPLDTSHQRRYRVTAATNESEPPALSTAARGVELIAADQFGTNQRPSWLTLGFSFIAGGIGLFLFDLFFRSLRPR